MICPNCKNEIPDGVKFCMHCGANVASPPPSEPVINEPVPSEPVTNEPAPEETAADEQYAFIEEEPVIVEESAPAADIPAMNTENTAYTENSVYTAMNTQSTAYNGMGTENPINAQTADIYTNNVDQIVAEALAPRGAATAIENAPEMPVGNAAVDYSMPQSAMTETEKKPRKKLNVPVTVLICILFGILITAFTAVSVAVSSVRQTLKREALSSEIKELEIGTIVVGDMEFAADYVSAGRLEKDSTLSDYIKVMIEDYEKKIARGILEANNVSIGDIDRLYGVDLEAFVDEIDGVDSVDDLDIDTLIENFSKFDKDEINIIINEYSNDDFPELTFDIDKDMVDEFLDDEGSPAKEYVSEIVKAYESCLLTGEDPEPLSKDKLSEFAEESVEYILDGMDRSFIKEINSEMDKVVTDNRKTIEGYNPSALFESVGVSPSLILSLITVFLALVLAVALAVVIGIISKRIDAAAITLGVSFLLTGGAAIAVNLLNLSAVTGLKYSAVSKTATKLFSKTFAADLTSMGIRSLIVGVLLIAVVVVVKVIVRAIRNKKQTA